VRARSVVMLKFLPGNLKLAVAVVAGWRLLQNVRRNHLSKAGREKRLLKEETSFVMAEIENPEFLKELCAGKSDSNDENLAPLGDGEAYSPVLSACRQLSARQSTERRHGGRPHTSRLSEKLQELKRGVEADGGFPICAIVNGDLERSLLRFLISTDFDVGKAREKIAAMKQWREENDIDHILRWILPEEKLGHLKRCMPSSHHGYDKEGHPIHFEQTGRFRWEILKHCSAEELVKIHILAQEYQARVLFPRASAMMGYTVDKMANILDLRGLNIGVLSNLHALNIFKEVQRIDQQNYPEMLRVTYIVNANWVFRAVWNVLKICFPARDHKKLRLVPRGQKGLKMLREVIPEEHIPKIVGINCDSGGESEQSADQGQMLRDLNEIRNLFSRAADKSDKYIQRSIRIWSVDPKRNLALEYEASETVIPNDLCKGIHV